MMPDDRHDEQSENDDVGYGHRFCAGDSDALGQLLVKHDKELRACLWRLQFGISKSGKEPDDILQEFALHLMARHEQFDPNRPWLPWAKQVLRNCVVTWLRHKELPTTEWKPEHEQFGVDQSFDDINDSDEAKKVAERQRIFEECFAELSPLNQELLRLSWIAGQSVRAISEQLADKFPVEEFQEVSLTELTDGQRRELHTKRVNKVTHAIRRAENELKDSCLRRVRECE